MWDECGRHVLLEELKILQPKRILVVGNSDNAAAVRTHILPGGFRELGIQQVATGRGTTRLRLEARTATYGPVELVSVPHTAWPGGTSRSLVTAMRELLRTAPSP